MENIDFTNEGIFYNEVGKDEKKQLTYDQIANTLAADATTQGAADYGAVITKQMNSFKNQD
jgi:hypothetical protein